jgi:hypothetical protein
MTKIIPFCAALLILSACVRPHEGPVKTTIITFPNGGMIEYNGHVMAKEPVELILPQDERGRLTNKVVIRALPQNTNVFAQTRILEPATRSDPVPNKIMLDMTANTEGTNRVDMVEYNHWREKQREIKESKPRSKPTRAVGVP